jgi:hypothetical protein
MILAEVIKRKFSVLYIPIPRRCQDTRHVLKGTSPNGPIKETQADMKFQELNRREVCPHYENRQNYTNN